MLKRDLLALIAHLPDDADIRVATPSRDYWQTTLATDIERVTEEMVSPSAYHDGQLKIDNDDEDAVPTYVLW